MVAANTNTNTNTNTNENTNTNTNTNTNIYTFTNTRVGDVIRSPYYLDRLESFSLLLFRQFAIPRFL